MSNIIDRLDVPKIPAGAEVSDDSRHGTLNRISHWLMLFLTEPASRERARAALQDIRAVRSLRNLDAHPGEDTRRRALANLSRLGLPSPILDHPAAWVALRTILAGAFDIIRLELQSQPQNVDRTED